eukprot:2377323-Prymnesium_polylepis.1
MLIVLRFISGLRVGMLYSGTGGAYSCSARCPETVARKGYGPYGAKNTGCTSRRRVFAPIASAP